MPLFQIIQNLLTTLRQLSGFVLGGGWLLTLYVFTGWMVIGSLGSIQLRDALELEQPGATFEDVERARHDFKTKEGAIRGRERRVKVDELWKAANELQYEYDGAWEKIAISAPKLNLVSANDSVYDNYLPYREKILRACAGEEQGKSAELTQLCETFERAETLGKQMDLAFDKAEAEEQKGANEPPDLKLTEKIAELQEETPFTDLFGTATFMTELGYGMFLKAPRELLVLQLTMIMGMLGSVVTMTWSFIRRDNGVSVRRFVFLPFVGSISAIIIFVFLKAGQLTIGSGAGSSALGPFFLSFVGIVSGLLSERAYARMESVGKNFFSVEKEEFRWGVRLKEAMESAGIGLDELASYLDVDEDSIASIVDEKSSVTLQQQKLIAACLRRSIRDLFTDVPPVSKPTGAQASPEEQVQVPDLIGKQVSVCEQELAALGLRLGNSLEKPSDDFAVGQVFDQTPSGHQKVARDTPVNVTVSTGHG